MKQIFIDFVSYVEQGSTPASLVDIENEIGMKNLRAVSISLLGWLKSMNNLKKSFPTRIDKNFQWQRDFVLILNRIEDLNEIFTVTEYRICVAEKVSEVELTEIWEYVGNNYKPPLFVTNKSQKKMYN